MLNSVMNLVVFTLYFLLHDETAFHLVFTMAQSSGRTRYEMFINLHCVKECDRQQSVIFYSFRKDTGFHKQNPQVMC